MTEYTTEGTLRIYAMLAAEREGAVHYERLRKEMLERMAALPNRMTGKEFLAIMLAETLHRNYYDYIVSYFQTALFNLQAQAEDVRVEVVLHDEDRLRINVYNADESEVVFFTSRVITDKIATAMLQIPTHQKV